MIHEAAAEISDLISQTKPWAVIAITGLIGVAVWIEKFDEDATIWSTFGLAVSFLAIGFGLYLGLDTVGALP